jgi:tripeptide aminopeptidase
MEAIAAVAGYTLDGSGAGELEGENFSADQLIVKAIGHNIHPSIGKGRMINAVRGISRLVDLLPLDHCSPESTADRAGFLHPYSVSGGVGQAELRILLRDFETARLGEYEALVRQLAEQTQQALPGMRFEIVRQRQYRNMADCLAKHPQVLDLAERALTQLGRPCVRGSIRGGTDGAMLSEKGLPTPNLSVGQHNIHSVLEFVSLDEMTAAVEHLVVLADLWQQHGRA